MPDRVASPETSSAPGEPVQMTDAEAVALAVALHRLGRLEEADGIYRRILEAIPAQADALHFHGLLLFQQGNRAAGIQSVRRALATQPDYVEAQNNLGNMLKEMGDDEGALQAYSRVLELRPDHADTHSNIGVLLRKQGRTAQALKSYERAVQLDPDHSGAFHNLGNLLQGLQRWDEAAAAFRRAVELCPTRDATYVELGRIYRRAGRIAEAEQVYGDWLRRDPTNPVAQHLAAACRGEAGPSRASDDYVRRTFDAFAQSYDDVLQGLEYHVPDLVAGVLQEGILPGAGETDILDAGCGTGLCGVRLRPFARRLSGVDLSPKMLNSSRERGIYDELFEAELTDYLTRHPQQFGLIVSGDTLVYFGELGTVFAAVETALLPGGRFLFSLEREPTADADAGYRIQPHGRYCHTETYVRQATARTGLQVCWVRACTVRLELGEPVSGMLVLVGVGQAATSH